MLIYNVTVKVDADIQSEWLKWMYEVHIPEVMATGKFLEYRVCRLLQDESEGVTFAVQYFSPDLATLVSYQDSDARRLQEAHAQRFSGRYVAFRTAMEVLTPPFDYQT
jgi:hypothetical protein